MVFPIRLRYGNGLSDAAVGALYLLYFYVPFELIFTIKLIGIKDSYIALFGSFLNGNFHKDSDIDMIIISNLFEGKNLFEHINMTNACRRLFACGGLNASVHACKTNQ